MFAAVTDHVFVDGGHTIDFTNKAFEVLDHLGWAAAPEVLPTLAAQTAAASRSEEQGCVALPGSTSPACCAPRPPRSRALAAGAAATVRPRRRRRRARVGAPRPRTRRPWSTRSTSAIATGATAEELARAVAYAAALRITRFHMQNDHGDWDVVHHGFTAANALHQARRPVADARAAPRRVPRRAARLPRPVPQRPGGPAAGAPGRPARRPISPRLQGCWDQEGRVDEAGTIVYRYLRAGGDPAPAVAALGRALLTEDAEFHWFQTYEAAVRQSTRGPPGPSSRRCSSPAPPASSPPTPRPAASCRRSCASPPGCAEATPSSRRRERASVRTACDTFASGGERGLVAPLVFKTSGTGDPRPVGSIPATSATPPPPSSSGR